MMRLECCFLALLHYLSFLEKVERHLQGRVDEYILEHSESPQNTL